MQHDAGATTENDRIRYLVNNNNRKLLLAVIMNVADWSHTLQLVQQSGTAMERLLDSWRVRGILLRLVETLLMPQSGCLEIFLRARQLPDWRAHARPAPRPPIRLRGWLVKLQAPSFNLHSSGESESTLR